MAWERHGRGMLCVNRPLKGSSVGRILKKDYHPRKTQVAQALSKRDKVSRQQYCYEFLDFVNNSRDIGNTLLMSEEALPYVWLCA